MSAPLRIYPHANFAKALSPGKKPSSTEGLKKYTDRLVRLIPAEIVGLYLGGKTAIAARFPSGAAADPNTILTESKAWLLWSLICLIAVIGVRSWATSDWSRDVPIEKGSVFIATISLVIWVYSFGDVFRIVFNVWDPLIATFAVLIWTFAVPAVYGRDT